MSNLLKDYPVIVEFPIAWGEMDAMSHVNNIVYFRFFESARIAYFEKMDLMGYMTKTGLDPFSPRHPVNSRYPCPIRTRSSSVRKWSALKKIGLSCITCRRTKHQKVAAEGDGVIVTFNYQKGKKVTVPEVVKQSIFDIEKSAPDTVK